MDARSVIDKFIDGVKLLEHYNFKHIDDNGNVIRACCKMHNGNNPTAFAYNTTTNEWFCHTGGCGGGDAYQLISNMEKCNYPQAIMRMAEIFNVDISNLTLTTIKNANQKEQDEWLKLVEKAMRKRKCLTSFFLN